MPEFQPITPDPPPIPEEVRLKAELTAILSRLREFNNEVGRTRCYRTLDAGQTSEWLHYFRTTTVEPASKLFQAISEHLQSTRNACDDERQRMSPSERIFVEYQLLAMERYITAGQTHLDPKFYLPESVELIETGLARAQNAYGQAWNQVNKHRLERAQYILTQYPVMQIIQYNYRTSDKWSAQLLRSLKFYADIAPTMMGSMVSELQLMYRSLLLIVNYWLSERLGDKRRRMDAVSATLTTTEGDMSRWTTPALLGKPLDEVD